MAVSQDPFQSVACEPGADVRVLVNIEVVIEINETVTNRLAKNDPDGHGQKNADRDDRSPFVMRTRLRRGRRRQYLRYAKSGLTASGARLLRRLGFSSSYDPAAASHRFVEPLERLVARRIPTLFVFGAEHVTYKDFERSRQGRLGRILERAGPLVEVVALEGEAYPFATLSGQEATLRTMKDWIVRSRVRQTD